MRFTKTKLAVLSALTLLLVACAAYKPARVLAPEQFGMTCPEPTLCIDDIAALPKAKKLRTDAVQIVESRFGPFKKEPRVLFCTTKDCFKTFGPPVIAAQNVGRSGSVINAIGWHDHIVRHELIHHWQNEQFGLIKASHGLPRWYIEGMAYELSEDPRDTIPNEQAQGYRETFRAWTAAGNDWRIPPE